MKRFWNSDHPRLPLPPEIPWQSSIAGIAPPRNLDRRPPKWAEWSEGRMDNLTAQPSMYTLIAPRGGPRGRLTEGFPD
jgi:hypothetical protein